jgi:hypothetical protein
MGPGSTRASPHPQTWTARSAGYPTAASAEDACCPCLGASPKSRLYREPLMLALNCSFHRRKSSTRLSRTSSADVATFGERALRSGIAEGGRGVTNSSTWPSRTLSGEVETFDGRALRSGIAEGGRGVAPVSLCPCAPRWAAYARSRKSAEKAEPPIDRAATTARPISKRFMLSSTVSDGLRLWSR